MDEKRKLLKQLKMGTTEILILAILTQGEKYGYEISKEVLERSEGFFELKQGFLYPTLNRMERSNFISGFWKRSRKRSPNRKYYRLTQEGHARLEASINAWLDFRSHFDKLLSIVQSPEDTVPE